MDILHLPCHNNNTYIWRIGELDYLFKSNILYNLHREDKSLWIRSVPELINDYNIKSILDKEKRYTKVYNTHIHFYKWDCKEKAFDIWKKEGLNTPDFCLVDSLNDILSFCKTHRKIVLRINNNYGRRQTYFLNSNNINFERVLNRNYQDLLMGLEEKMKDNKQTKIICVEYLNDNTTYHKYIRSFVVNDKVVLSVDHGQLCSINKWYPSYNGEANGFIERNRNLLLTDKIENQLKKSISCFGLYMAAVDWIMIDDKCYLLEVNPYWGMGYEDVAGGFPFFKGWANEVRRKYDSLPENLKIRLNTDLFWDLIYRNAFPHLF